MRGNQDTEFVVIAFATVLGSIAILLTPLLLGCEQLKKDAEGSLEFAKETIQATEDYIDAKYNEEVERRVKERLKEERKRIREEVLKELEESNEADQFSGSKQDSASATNDEP